MNIHNKDGMFFRKIWAFATRKGQENSQKRRKWEQKEIMKHFFSIFIALGGEKSNLNFSCKTATKTGPLFLGNFYIRIYSKS